MGFGVFGFSNVSTLEAPPSILKGDVVSHLDLGHKWRNTCSGPCTTQLPGEGGHTIHLRRRCREDSRSRRRRCSDVVATLEPVLSACGLVPLADLVVAADSVRVLEVLEVRHVL